MSLYRSASWEMRTTSWACTSGILMVTDIERTNVEFVCRTLGCTPVQRIDSPVTSSMRGAPQRPSCCSDCASCWWPQWDWTCTTSGRTPTPLRWTLTPWQRMWDWSPLRSWQNWGSARWGKGPDRYLCEDQMQQWHVRKERHPAIVGHGICDQAGNLDCAHDFEGETRFCFSVITTNEECRTAIFE